MRQIKLIHNLSIAIESFNFEGTTNLMKDVDLFICFFFSNWSIPSNAYVQGHERLIDNKAKLLP